MRKAASIPSGSRRSTFFWASAGVAAKPAASSKPRKRLAATRHLRCAAQQIDLLSVVRREHLDQDLVRRVASESISRFENRFVDSAQTRLELSNRLRRQRRFLLVENVLQRSGGAQIVVLFNRERSEAGRRCLVSTVRHSLC